MATKPLSPPPLRAPLQLPGFHLGRVDSAGSGNLPTATLTSANLSPVWIGWFTDIWNAINADTPSVRSVTASTTIDPGDSTVVFVIAAPTTATLPDATAVPGKLLIIKNDATSTDVVTLAGPSLIDNAAASTVTLANGNAITLQSDGTNWIVINRL